MTLEEREKHVTMTLKEALAFVGKHNDLAYHLVKEALHYLDVINFEENDNWELEMMGEKRERY